MAHQIPRDPSLKGAHRGGPRQGSEVKEYLGGYRETSGGPVMIKRRSSARTDLEFRKVPSLRLLYEVSSDGRVLRNVKSKRQIKVKLEFHHNTTGYYGAYVCIAGKVVHVRMATIVAECWLGPRPVGYEVDHRDRNSRNDDHRNLRYVTRSEQMRNRDHTRIAAVGKMNLTAHQRELSHPVKLTGPDGTTSWPSMSAAARYLGTLYAVKADVIMTKFKRRRRRVYDHDVTYLNVETANGCLEGQGTVQLDTDVESTSPEQSKDSTMRNALRSASVSSMASVASPEVVITMNENMIRPDDDIEVINAKLMTNLYADLTDEAIVELLMNLGVNIDGVIVVNGRLVRKG